MSGGRQAPPVALTIAGSDSGGGAGIQADLKTFAALEVHGLSAVTALTAQSTTEVRAVLEVPASFVAAQLETVADDFAIGAAKSGMLASAEVIEVVAGFARARALPLVVDPVLVASSGARLVSPGAMRATVSLLFPLAALVTPNLDEVGALLGEVPRTVDAMVDAGRALVGLGARAALVKGGHLEGDPVDVLVGGDGAVCTFAGPRIATRATHGTGCTYAAAIAAHLARGEALPVAVERAHAYLRGALAGAHEGLGRGPGPVHHLHRFHAWPR